MRFIVLGAGGFIGRSITAALINRSMQVVSLRRDSFDILNETTYTASDFSDSIIVDCITCIDGSPEENDKLINIAFQQFLTYLKQHHTNFSYIYFSTISTLMPDVIASNSYVKAKFTAEKYLAESGIDHKIIRLSFPFGIGENKNRLVSRIIRQLHNNEVVKADDVTLNLTPVDCLTDSFISLIQNKEQQINFIVNGPSKLQEVIIYMKDKIGSSSEISFSEKSSNLSLGSYISYSDFSKKLYDSLDKMCVYAK